MEKDRMAFLIEVSFKVANLRDMDKILPLLASHGILKDDEISMCLASAVVINGKRLDKVIKLFDSTNESIKGSDLSQEDETLLN